MVNFHIFTAEQQRDILEGRTCTDEGFSVLISEDECYTN